jgi:hypothetical protein
VTAAVVLLAGAASRRAAETQISAVLQDATRRTSGRAEGRIARLLVIVQVVAVSLVMYFGSVSALIAYRTVNVDFGYDTNSLLSAGLALPQDRYSTAEGRGRLFQGVFDRLAQRSELDGVVLRTTLADVSGPRGALEIDGRQGANGPMRAHSLALLGPLTPLGIGLREGRFFDTRDNETGVRTALVSQAMAERYWPGRSPVGERIRLTGIDEMESRTIVGIVGNVLLGGPLDPTRGQLGVYVPLRQTSARFATVEFRHVGSEPAARAAYQESLTELDPLLVSEVRSFDEMLETMTVLATSVTKLFGGCFVFALLLAVSGTYGLMARSITRRIQEIGVRRALGASDRAILAMLLGQSARQLAVGVLVALPFAMATGWGISRLFPVSIAASITTALLVSGAIAVVVLAATWLPARRAIAVPPQHALRRE